MIITVTLGRPTIRRNYLHTALHELFIDNVDLGTQTVAYEHVHNKKLYFKWMENILVPNMFPGAVSKRAWVGGVYNETLNDYQDAIAGKIGYRIGSVRFRQLRVESDSCVVSGRFRRVVDRCYSKYDGEKTEEVGEVWDDSGVGWVHEAALTEEEVRARSQQPHPDPSCSHIVFCSWRRFKSRGLDGRARVRCRRGTFTRS